MFYVTRNSGVYGNDTQYVKNFSTYDEAKNYAEYRNNESSDDDFEPSYFYVETESGCAY